MIVFRNTPYLLYAGVGAAIKYDNHFYIRKALRNETSKRAAHSMFIVVDGKNN